MKRRTMLHGIGAGAAGVTLGSGAFGRAGAERTDESDAEPGTIEGTVVVAANPGNGRAAVEESPGAAREATGGSPNRNAAAESIPGTGVDGALVRALADDGTELDAAETDDGAYSLDVGEVDPDDVRVVLVVDGDAEVDGQGLYAAAEREVGEERTAVDFTITREEVVTSVEVDGEDVAVAYGIAEDAGTDGDHVGTVEQLQAIETGEDVPLDGEYHLVADVDASATWGWNDGEGFEPIGKDGELGGVDEEGNALEPFVGDEPFVGTLDGDGYEIRGLFVDRERNQVGLFGAAREARVANVELRDVDVTGLTNTGALIGKAFGGTVEGSSALDGRVRTDGAVLLERRDEVEFDAFVGGLVGEVDGGADEGIAETAVVSGCESDVHVEEGEVPEAEGAAVGQAGGLVGQLRNGARLEDSVARGDVVGVTSDVGGLVGEVDASLGNDTTVAACAAYGDVSTAAEEDVTVDRDVEEYGGLVGENDDGGIVVGCEAHGDVDTTGADASEEVGGLVGQHNAGGVIEDSFATGDVAGDEEVGGLVGENDDGDDGALIRRCYASGDVAGNAGVGGLVGENDDGATVDRSYAIAAVRGDEAVGGLVGENASGGTITESYAAGPVAGGVDAGGAVGANDGDVDRVYWDAATTGQAESAGSPDENGLETEAMQGDDLDAFLEEDFDFEATWETVGEGRAEASEDGYPILRAIDREGQLVAQGILDE